ncbi:MAG TPA: Rieske (2Fe-2S) protein [Stellaceae bacterium]|nr:Rieske (2Fe-2S) protein [Stellaceae bacterium]
MGEFDQSPAAYIAGAPFQRERQTVFAAHWLVFAASAQMPAAGDYVMHNLGGWPLFAIRGEDGIARAFHNLCRHQGMPVVERAAGACAVLRCRYHGWTYDLAGRFRDAPPRAAPTEPAAQLGLAPAELAEQDGICLVRVRAGGEPLPRLALPPGRLAAATATDLYANWKAAIEILLARPDWRFLWPLAFVRKDAGGGVLRQIVPRSFLRTRFVDLVFAPGGVFGDKAAAAWRERAAADKDAAENCQRAHAAGTAAPPAPGFAEFLARLAAGAQEG